MTVSPGTDSIDAEAARAAVATVCQYFEQDKIIHRVMSEGPEGTLIDTIMILLPRRCWRPMMVTIIRWRIVFSLGFQADAVSR
jgi:hypothetical protein